MLWAADYGIYEGIHSINIGSLTTCLQAGLPEPQWRVRIWPTVFHSTVAMPRYFLSSGCNIKTSVFPKLHEALISTTRQSNTEQQSQSEPPFQLEALSDLPWMVQTCPTLFLQFRFDMRLHLNSGRRMYLQSCSTAFSAPHCQPRTLSSEYDVT